MSLPASYFDRMYADGIDPWGFRDRPYEARKRGVTMAALTSPHYGTVFEPGCSIGILTNMLARRSERVLAMDPAVAAIEEARATVPADRVELVVGRVPADWPPGSWDLVVLSEVGYYLGPDDLHDLADRASASAAELVAVHWRHPVADYPAGGDEVHAALGEAADAGGLTWTVSHLEDDFRLDVWCRDPRSVAGRDGLLG